MTLCWFYQINILPKGFQRNFIILMAFVSISFILITAYDVKPLFKSKKEDK